MRMIFTAVMLTITTSAPAVPASGPTAVQPLTITSESSTVTATCALIHRFDHAEGAILYFATAGRLFRSAEGARRPSPTSIVVGRRGESLTIRPQDVLLPVGNLIDIAVLRASVPQTELAVAPIDWEPPAPNEAFQIDGFSADGNEAWIAERVRYGSTLLTIGDHDASILTGCIGAPATTAAGIFGIVTSCERGRTPIITLLRGAKRFITSQLAGDDGPVRR
jgi:hypothetical protein